MAVERAFGVAGGSGGVAKRGGAPFVQFRPLDITGLRGNQRLVARQVRGATCRLAALFGQPHNPARRREMRRQALDQRGKARIHKEQAVRGMIDDVNDLLVEEPRVDRVADRTNARDCVIKFEVAKPVPREGRDPVAASDPEPLQCASQLLGPVFCLGIGVAVDSALDGSRDDLRLAMIDSGMFDYRRDQERSLHIKPCIVHPGTRRS